MSKYNKAIPAEAFNRKVFVYFNLHSGLWSVKDVQTGLILGHSDRVALVSATFKVSQAGRQRVIREQRKNVHAGVQGYLVAFGDGAAQYQRNLDMKSARLYGIVATANAWDRVTYNPYKFDSFVKAEDTSFKVQDAAYACLGLNRAVWAQSARGF